MPTKREREYYAAGYRDGRRAADIGRSQFSQIIGDTESYITSSTGLPEQRSRTRKPRRKLSDWQKFIKANSSKKKFKFANGKLKLKSMGIAYRKTAAYKRNKKK